MKSTIERLNLIRQFYPVARPAAPANADRVVAAVVWRFVKALWQVSAAAQAGASCAAQMGRAAAPYTGPAGGMKGGTFLEPCG